MIKLCISQNLLSECKQTSVVECHLRFLEICPCLLCFFTAPWMGQIGAQQVWRKREMHTRFWWGNMKDSGHF